MPGSFRKPTPFAIIAGQWTTKEAQVVVTMLEAEVAEDRSHVLVERFASAGDTLPPSIIETFLLHDDGTARWRIITVWSSEDALTRYRESVETPEGVRMFHTAGAEPELTISRVVEHAANG